MQPINGKHLHCNHIHCIWSCLLDYALPGVDHQATACAITHFNNQCLILMNYSMGCCIVQNKWDGINGMTGNNAFVIVYTAIKLNTKNQASKICTGIDRNKVKTIFKAVDVDQAWETEKYPRSE